MLVGRFKWSYICRLRPRDWYPAGLCVAVALFCAPGWAQTTRPDGDVLLTWGKQVSSIAAAAAGHDSQGLESLIDPDCKLRRFSSEGNCDIAEFVDFATNTAVIGDHAYVFPA